MSKLLLASISNNGIRMNNAKMQPLITWFNFLNFFTIAVLLLLMLKIYKSLLLFYKWLFPVRYSFESPTILVIGPKNDITQEIVLQLSQKFNSEIFEFQDINDNTNRLAPNQNDKKSHLIYSHLPVRSQEIVTEFSHYIRKSFGSIDILVIAQNEEPVVSDSTHSFLTQLNKQLLAQFWTVMAFLPEMLRRNNGYIISVSLGKSSLTNTGIMRTVYEELLQCNTKVKLSLIESNTLLDSLPSLSSDILAKLIVRSMWSFHDVVKVPSLSSYILMLPFKLFGYFIQFPKGSMVFTPIVSLLGVVLVVTIGQSYFLTRADRGRSKGSRYEEQVMEE